MIKRYELLWENFITREIKLDIIEAKNLEEAKEIAYSYIEIITIHDKQFAKDSILYLEEERKRKPITKEFVNYLKKERDK